MDNYILCPKARLNLCANGSLSIIEWLYVGNLTSINAYKTLPSPDGTKEEEK